MAFLQRHGTIAHYAVATNIVSGAEVCQKIKRNIPWTFLLYTKKKKTEIGEETVEVGGGGGLSQLF